jgi:hypothetical protein
MLLLVFLPGLDPHSPLNQGQDRDKYVCSLPARCLAITQYAALSPHTFTQCCFCVTVVPGVCVSVCGQPVAEALLPIVTTLLGSTRSSGPRKALRECLFTAAKMRMGHSVRPKTGVNEARLMPSATTLREVLHLIAESGVPVSGLPSRPVTDGV